MIPTLARSIPALLFLWSAAIPAHAADKGTTHREIVVEAPFEMPPIRVPVFPERDFPVTEFREADARGSDLSAAIGKAIEACHKAGGGRVVVPRGKWSTGPVHLRSNVNLHLEKDAVLLFSGDPKDYLPAVRSSWEGMECYNYSPLVYAYDCENVAITGEGKLEATMDTWRKWTSRPPAHMAALKELYRMASEDVPVEERQMARGENNLRPQFIQFNRCRNVLIEGVSIRRSPFWTIHLLLCDSVLVRKLDIWATGRNNDGIDPEMTRNLLVEDCVFEQGDDAIAIKAGRNRDAWRLDTPTENIVVRNCLVRKGHQLVAIGSELSGGVRNVHVHDCSFEKGHPHNILFIKTNHRRGGFVENITVENIRADRVRDAVIGIRTDVLYQWKDLVPTYETRLTPIRDVRVANIRIGEVGRPYDIRGDKRQPIEGVVLEDIRIDAAADKDGTAHNVNGLETRNLEIGGGD